LKNKRKAAINRFIASQHGKNFIVTNLVSEIAYQYFDLVTLDSELNILKENIILQQDALNTVEAQKTSARVNELAVEIVAAQLLNTKALEAELKQKVVECESRLSYLCGGFPTTIKRATALLDTSIQEVPRIGIPSDLLRYRPDIKEAEMQLLACRADVNSARAAFYPSININAAIGFQAFNSMLLLESPASLAYNFMGGLTAPLLNRRKIKADLMVAKAEQRISYINYESKVVNGFLEVYNAINSISNTNSMIRFKMEEVSILKKSVETSAELFKAGRANYLEVIYSQKNSLQTQLELADYKKKLNVAKVKLYRSLGGGWK
jgi:multidrug efflux system outer membrane protein